MIEIRARTRIPSEELDDKIGKVLGPEDVNVLLTGPTFVRSPTGAPLLCYLPGAIPPELREAAYPILTQVRVTTMNRGLAAGARRLASYPGAKTTNAKSVVSSTLGALDGSGARGGMKACRLTAWTGKNVEAFRALYPLFSYAGEQFREHVPERWAAQMGYIAKTNEDWVIPGTPYTTITVNNTYPTGVHQDKGDLDEGFSTLMCLRRGDYGGGIFTLAEYRIGVDLQDGDLILMDAHQWHGNTDLDLRSDDAERISLVAYFRTKLIECASLPEEKAKMIALAENAYEGA